MRVFESGETETMYGERVGGLRAFVRAFLRMRRAVGGEEG